MTKKTFAFIDSQNLNLGVKSQGWELDWSKFRQYLRNKYNVSTAYLFIGHVNGNESLYTYLQKCGYILILKPTLEHKVGNKIVVKGNVDAELVLHTMIEFSHFEKAVIVSGDGDFHCLVEYLVSKDKLLRVLAPNRNYSGLLREFNQYVVRVDLLKKSLAKENKKTKISVRSKP
ncbi:NYN domain-containing protein [Candidatus Shapirobacteria bacterium]|nr:NYN domain-containing protein [Candidatus Shapirobacteria bacterium]